MKRTVKKFLLLILTVLMTAFVGVFAASCGEELGTLKQSKILYDGNNITWSRVSGAKEYIVIVNGAAAKTVEQPAKGETPKFKYPSKGRNEVEVSIQPIGKEEEGKKVSRTFTRLATIQTSDITFSEEGVMSWNIVEGADSYMLKLGDTEVSVAEEEYSEFVYDGKSTSIQIRPVCSDGTTFSDYSSSISKVFLAEVDPAKITYDGEVLSWQSQGYAQGYEIYIDGAPIEGGIIDRNSHSYRYNAENKSFNVAIKAIGDQTNAFSSPLAEEKKFTFLPVIDNLNVSDGILSWNPIEEADKYAVKIGNNGREQVFETKETQYSLSSGTSLSVSVKPVMEVGDVYFSAYSEVKSVFILSTPEIKWDLGFSLDDGEEANAISWNSHSEGEGGYMIKVELPNGTVEENDVGPLNRDYKSAFLDVGTYKISVKALAGNVSQFDSKYSSPITVERLAAPRAAVQDFITSDPTDNSKFTVSWNKVQSASSYAFYKAGTKLDLNPTITTQTVTGIVDSTISTEQKIEYGIQSVGKRETNPDGTPRIVLSSLISKNLTFDITVLAMPQNVDIPTGGTKMTWSTVPSANSYGLKADSTVNDCIQPEYDMAQLSAGSHKLSVCSKGNGNSTLASNYTPEKAVYRLDTPSNLKIGVDSGDEGTWKWDSVEYAKSYAINLKAQNRSLEFNNSGAMVEEGLITTDGTTVSVTAVANYYGSNDVYYITGKESPTKTFTKLQAPTFNNPIVVGKTLQWNAPSNVSASQYTPTYVLYENQSTRYSNGVCNAPEKKLTKDYFPAGTHTFLIKAIGDGVNYINSAFSEKKTITILESPTVARADSVYEWSKVAQATGYNVKIGGNLVKEVDLNEDATAKYSFDPKEWLIEVDQTYSVEISSRGNDNNSELNGETVIESWPTEIRTKVLRLPTPEFTFDYQDSEGNKLNNANVSGRIVVKITNTAQLSNANGYAYSIEGTDSDRNLGAEYSEVLYNVSTTEPYEILAWACGGKFDEQGNYYVDSYKNHSNDAHSITILGKPTDVVKDGDDALTWQGKTGSDYGYTIKLHYGDNKIITITHSAARLFVGRSYSSTEGNFTFTLEGLNKVEICANGNGSTVVGSDWHSHTF